MKQRRIKKLVKGHLNAKDAEGGPLHPDLEERLLQLMGKSTAFPAENLTDAQLLDVLLDADADSTSHKDDFAPFDAREQKDTDGDGIGDNRDILLNKIALDVIYKEFDENDQAVNPPTGALVDLLDRLAAAKTDLQAAANIADAQDKKDRYALLVAEAVAPADGGIPEQTSLPGDLTDAGLDALQAEIDAKSLEAQNLIAEIGDATATAGVAIEGLNPYHLIDASTLAKQAAGATDVVTPTAGVVQDVADSKTAITTIDP